MQAVILAGGEGRRLRPLTARLPKPMIPLLNRPFLQHTLEYLKSHGVTEVFLALGYLPDAIRAFFGDGAGLGVRLRYSVEESPLGTAGAVKLLEPRLSGACIVLNGDTVTDMDLTRLQRLHQERGAAATLFLVPVADPSRFGVVETGADGRVLRFTEKPRPGEARANTINGGCYILEPEVFAHVPPGTYHMFEDGVFPQLLQMGAPVFSYTPSAYWEDVGTPRSYLQVHRDILLGRVHPVGLEPLPASGVRLGPGCLVHPTARIAGAVVLGSRCAIGPGALVTGPAVLGDDCSLGEGASVSDSVLWRGVTVGARTQLHGCCVADGARFQEDVAMSTGIVGAGATVGRGKRFAGPTSVDAEEVVEG